MLHFPWNLFQLLITKCWISLWVMNHFRLHLSSSSSFIPLCATNEKTVLHEKRKLQFTMLEERKNKHGGNKTWIMEIGDISESKIYTPLLLELQKNFAIQVCGNLIKFLFIEISIFLFLIISWCSCWGSGKWTFNYRMR